MTFDPTEQQVASLAWSAEVTRVSDFFKVIAAGPAFFVSAWVLMIFAGIVYQDVGTRPFGYVTAMIVTIGLWLTLAPAIGAVSRVTTSKSKSR
jgi:hypothetical protein